MALTVMDGFESVPILRNGLVIANGAASAVTGRDGVGKALAGTTNTGTMPLNLPTNQAVTILGLGVKWLATGFGSTAAQSSIIFQGDAAATSHLTINTDGTGKLLLRRGTASGTIIGTGITSLTSGAWGYLEVKATIADAGGICIVKWNGVTEINFSGDTKNVGTLTSLSTIALGLSNTAISSIDDLYVLDGTGSAPYNDFLGERVIKAARPIGNGALSQWTGSDGNSTDNYALVDEDPLNTTDYVASSTAGQQDTYDFAAVPGLSAIDAVSVYAYGAKSDSGARSVKLLTRSPGGTLNSSATIPLSTTYTMMQDVPRTTAPGSVAWTPALVNTHEYGIEAV